MSGIARIETRRHHNDAAKIGERGRDALIEDEHGHSRDT